MSPSRSRRRLRANGIFAALLVASACARPAPFTVRAPLEPGADAGPPPSPAPEVRVLLFGDFGDGTGQQRAIAAGLASAAARVRFDLAFHAGDNLYECGPDPRAPGAAGCRFAPDANAVDPAAPTSADPRFGDRFEAPLAGFVRDGAPIPIYLALGNHDVASHTLCREGGLAPTALARLRACLEVAHRSPRWNLPGRHYVLDRGPARFVVLDTNLLFGDYGGFTLDDEVRFLAGAAAGAGDRFVFVVAHHPAATAGTHAQDFSPEYVARLRRLQEAGGGRIAAWISGHDHDLQHLRTAAGFDAFVSGNGARGRPHERFAEVAPPSARLLFASTEWGFAWLEASREHWAIRFESDRGEPLHCCHAAGPGRCRPVACPVPR